MLKLILDDAKTFKDSLALVNELINEGVFSFSKEGIKLVAMDSTSVSMVIFHLLPSVFSEYALEKEFKVGLSIDQIRNVLKRITGTERVVIKISEEVFQIEIFGNHKKSFKLPILDLEKEPLRVPNLEFTSEIELNPDTLKDAVEDVAIISDSITFHSIPNQFSLKSTSGTSQVEINLEPSTSQGLIKLDVKEESKAKYSVDYLIKMIKANKISDTLLIGFKTDFPLKLEYATTDKLRVTYILAPMSG